MADSPNPYRPPDAPVDPHAESPIHHGLRVLLRALVVVQIALIPIAVMLPDTLPPELRQLRDDRDMAFINAHGMLAMLVIALVTAGLIGLWWEKRWAAWLYLAANATGYALQLAAGARIASDLSGLVDSAADASIGATLVVLYLGGFFTQQPHEPKPPGGA